ncbi:hypothetical protein LPJ61_000981 [Coemansia biformis]|uniref:GRAM domain-containing protein n=1 Tax=Coemansia biformis TaxID=1286918 RepID=A0A9W7YG14_9FUNG|nr:hypothetical protein LPJ61_000981 [Coemansia biformis]
MEQADAALPRQPGDSTARRTHHRRHSSGSVKDVLEGLFRRSSQSSLKPVSQEHSRRASGDEESPESRATGIKEEPQRAAFMLSDDSDGACGSGDEGGGRSTRQPVLKPAATFTSQYMSEPAPGMWTHGAQDGPAAAPESASDGPPRPNMPLEPEEQVVHSLPWVFDQLRMGERPFSTLFSNQIGYANVSGCNEPDAASQKANKTRMRKQAFGVLKGQVSEARVGIQKDAPLPDIADYRRPDGTANYIGYACDLAQHYADTQLSYKVDFRHSVTDPCKLDRVLTTLHRLVGVSAPYQRFLVWLLELARWDKPRVSLWWCAAYFFLLYHDMIALCLCLAPAFIVIYHRLRPSQAYDWLGFERPETSLIPAKAFQDAASGTLAKGLIANHMWGMWNDTLGSHAHFMLSDLADWMERMKNCATWKRPWASRVMVVVLACMGLASYLLPAAVFQKLLGAVAGVQFFFLTPLQLRHPRYRRMMWIIELLLWHCPSDVELAVEMLYNPASQRARGAPEALAQSDGPQPPFHAQLWAGIRVLAADMTYALNPLAKERGLPVMILQTASSATLDLMNNDVADELGLSNVITMGKQLGKSVLRDSDTAASGDDQYTGLGGADGTPLMSVMCESEEREWAQSRGLPVRRAPRPVSINSFGTLDADCIISPPADMRELGLDPESPVADMAQDGQPGDGPNTPHTLGAESPPKGGDDGGGGDDGSGAPYERKGSLSAWAKGITSHLRGRKKSSQGGGDGSRRSSNVPDMAPSKPTMQRSGAMSLAATEGGRKHRARHSMDDAYNMIAEYQDVARELGLQPRKTKDSGNASDTSQSAGSDTTDTPPTPADDRQHGPTGSSAPHITRTSSLELTHEANKLNSLRSKDARTTGDGFDHNSLFAFRCIHQGRYGTLFVTPEQFVFRRSRMMGGRRSSVACYRLSTVVAIRKSVTGIGKSHGVQMLLSNGRVCSFHGLSKRDDVFGFLLVRCGSSHIY